MQQGRSSLLSLRTHSRWILGIAGGWWGMGREGDFCCNWEEYHPCLGRWEKEAALLRVSIMVVWAGIRASITRIKASWDKSRRCGTQPSLFTRLISSLLTMRYCLAHSWVGWWVSWAKWEPWGHRWQQKPWRRNEMIREECVEWEEIVSQGLISTMSTEAMSAPSLLCLYCSAGAWHI